MKGISLALILFATQAFPQPGTSADAFEQNRRLGRGVNILGYDPIWRSRDQARFQEKHFRLLKEAGFGSVRVNLHPFRHMDRAADWKLATAWWATVDWALTNALSQGLVVILDLHEFNAIGDDPDANKERFLAFWRQMSARLQDAPDSVVFEVLNEPCKKLTPALWNNWLREALVIIREKNPARTVIAGPAFWNSVDHLHELELPENDRHLIVTVHYYKPMEFTHQGASWTGQKDKLGVDWQGSAAELEAIRRDFDKVGSWANQHKRPVLLGEFGAYDRAAMEARVRYLKAVTKAAEDRSWSWAYWQFDSDFVLWDMGRDAWVEPVLKALTGEPRRS